MSEMAKRCGWLALIVAVGVLTRVIPHPPNFSAFMAVALFAGFVLPGPLALLAPILGVFIGDMILGSHDLMWVVYLSLLPMVFLGRALPTLSRRAGTWFAWVGAGLAASVFFFVTTNLAVWWTSGMYAHTTDGLTSCFVLAIPFFHNSLLATWIYLAGFEIARRATQMMPAPVSHVS